MLRRPVFSLRFAVLRLMVVCIGVVPLAAQVTSGTIFGRVKDSSGAYVSNATVIVRSPQTGAERAVTTSDDGNFVVPNMPPATYDISVEAKGFKKLETRGVVLSAADKLNAGEFVLTIGTTAESVTVSADAGQLQLQTESGERSDLITNRQLNDVALNGRMILDYLKLIPGVVSNFDGSAATTWGIGAFNINGTRANQHEYTIDGSSNVDTGDNGTTHVTLNPDAVSEMKVLTSNYQAEFGKAAGGQVAVTTKIGTNHWHGDARFFHRNEGMNANGWFNNQNDPITPKPLYRYNYFGYQFGGPIKKDKLFVFWSQEFYRQLIPGGGIDQFRVPTALERQGDFSQSVDGDGNPLAIYDPGTGQPFPGNVIDPSALSASQQSVFAEVQKVLNLYPLPNVTTASTDEDLQDTFFPRKFDYRLASYDVPHVLAINYVYDVPSLTKRFHGPKWLSYVTDDFQLSGVTQFMSGEPVDPGIWWPPAKRSAEHTTSGGLITNGPGFIPPSAVM